MRAPRADRRVRARPAGAARQARVPRRRRRPRLRRQPALPADARLHQARGPRALPGVHGGAGRADRRQVRRLAEGRARHRREHGPVRRTRVGRQGDGDDVAGQAARRPARRPQSRRGPESRPGHPSQEPEEPARDRGDRLAVRRVRLLRARLPEPQRDHDAAPADRHPPRDGAPAGGLARVRGAAAPTTSTTRCRRAPPTAPARACVPSRSTPASW